MRYRTIALCIAAMTALAALPASAQECVDIIVANGLVARIRTGGSYGSIQAREVRINQNIVNALNRGNIPNIFPPKIRVYQANGLWTLALGENKLIEVYPQDAAGAGTDPKSLALQWKEKFGRQFQFAVPDSWVPPGYPLPSGGGGGDTGPQPSGLPAADDPLVDALVREMARIRAMDDDEFDERKDALEAGIIAMVCDYRQPEGFPNPPTSISRIKSLFIVLRGAGMNDQKFAVNKRMYAGQTIKKIRDEFDVPAGRGAIPSADEVLLPEVGLPGGPVTPPPTPEVPAIAPPEFAPGTPIAQAVLGTGLDPNNRLLNPGQHFAADASMVILYLQVCEAPNNTMVAVTMRLDQTIVGRRMLNLCGDRTLAVTFYPEAADHFTPGDYVCEITIAEQVAASIPFRVGAL